MKEPISMKQCTDTIKQMVLMTENEGVNIDVTFTVKRADLMEIARLNKEEIKDCSGVFVGQDVKAVFINQGGNLSISFWSYEQN